ncbi:hypothetical protein B4113_0814 [Geobacillus sp. B4113_201601]|nr:hypothetical protein B4113_0814 [Geobacillus sp. B4113_201601]
MTKTTSIGGRITPDTAPCGMSVTSSRPWASPLGGLAYSGCEEVNCHWSEGSVAACTGASFPPTTNISQNTHPSAKSARKIPLFSMLLSPFRDNFPIFLLYHRSTIIDRKIFLSELFFYV